MSKILLIEDDVQFAQLLVQTFSEHDVDHVSDGREGLNWLTQCHYEGAIIDCLLPSMDGVDVCRAFREGGGVTPILMLTARVRGQDQIVGLDAGADDYLCKPCDPEILRARLRAILRRFPDYKRELLSVGKIVMDSRRKSVLVDSQPVRLTKREFAILELLMRANGEPIDSKAILERVWPSDSEVSPESVRCHITRIRTQIGKVSKEAAETIQSIYGTGYLVKL
jgi:DNA-binding response OmpR family regulator